MTYGDTAAEYHAAGFQPLPLPAGQKFPPPSGFTGHTGRDVTEEDVLRWTESRAGDNIGIRLPDGVIGIDVDAYHGGLETLAKLEADLGKLPPTWKSTSRDDGSGILLYRAPRGMAWQGDAGPGIDIIQRGHRYAVVWPSIHPSGRTYRWHDPSGQEKRSVPAVDSLPELPPSWVTRLNAGEALGPAERLEQTEAGSREFLESLPKGDCPRVKTAVENWVSAMNAGNRHGNMLRGVLELVKLGREGHRGALAGLQRLRDAFESAIGGERAARPEYIRALRGAIAQTVGDPVGGPCQCAGDRESDTDPKSARRQWFRERVLDVEALSQVPPLDPLVDGWLYLDSTAWVIGKWGSAKSFVTLDIACSVAAGVPWHECATTPGPVLYIAAEGGRGIYPRVAAWQKHNRVAAKDLRVLPEPVQVSDTDMWQGLVEYAAEELRPVLVVIDTQARITVGMEENSAKDMGILVDRAEDLRRATGACVLLVHHTGKDGQAERGSSALAGAAQSMIRVTKVKNQPDVTVSTEKQKDTAPRPDMHFRLTDVEGTDSAVLVRCEANSPTTTLTIKQREVLECVQEWPTTRPTTPCTRSTVANALGMDASNLGKVVKALVEARWLGENEDKTLFARGFGEDTVTS